MPDLVLYDGVCGLCNRLNVFILRRDRADRFRFAPLQGALAGALLRKYGRDPLLLDTVHVIVNHGEPDARLLVRGQAILHVLSTLGGAWHLARLLKCLPKALIDWFYDYVATNRYRWFGRSETCFVPDGRDRAKFLEG